MRTGAQRKIREGEVLDWQMFRGQEGDQKKLEGLIRERT